MKAELRDAISHHPLDARRKLRELYELVITTAKSLPEVGAISEELRWGQPSFLTNETGSGSTIRMDCLRNDHNHVALYFHCQSGLIPQFRELYRGKLSFEKDRAIILAVNRPLPASELRHCISLALTHHLRKKVTKQTRLRK